MVQPGADSSPIQLQYDGASSLRLDEHGDLIVATAGGQLVQHAPVLYQNDPVLGRQSVTGEFTLADGKIGFAIGNYDRSKPLIIDPTLEFSTYLGGSSNEEATAISVGSDDSIAISGYTESAKFVTLNAAYGTLQGTRDAFVAVVGPDKELRFSTYLGGKNGVTDATTGYVEEQGNGVALVNDVVYVVGTTSSSDFPIAGNAVQKTLATPPDRTIFNAFVTQTSLTGTLKYSTFRGITNDGTHKNWTHNGHTYTQADWRENGQAATGVVVADDGTAYVEGGSWGLYSIPFTFPPPPSFSDDPDHVGDAFAFSLVASGAGGFTNWQLDGGYWSWGYGIALSPSGTPYIAGTTNSGNFPNIDGLYTTITGGQDSFVVSIDTSGGSVTHGSFLGGNSDDEAHGVAVDDQGNVYLAGSTKSSNFPLSNAMFSSLDKGSKLGAGRDAFVSRFNSAMTALSYSTYLGGAQLDYANAIAVDGNRRAHVTGLTTSNDFPMKDPYDSTLSVQDVFVTEINSAGSTLTYSTYIGGSDSEVGTGIAADSASRSYITGWTKSTDFPTAAALYSSNAGNEDAFISVLNPKRIADTPRPDGVVPTGHAYADQNEGGLYLGVIPTSSTPIESDCHCGLEQHAFSDILEENSATVDVHPIVRFEIPTANTDPTITGIQTALTWNGVSQGTFTHAVGGASPGDTLTLGMQLSSAVSTTAAYPWSAVTTLTYANSTTKVINTTGTSLVAAHDSSPYGAAWWVGGVAQVYDDGNGVMWVDANGDRSYYTLDGGGDYLSPLDDFGTLVKSGSNYEYTDKHQNVWHFNSSGLLETWKDRHGLTVTYTYNGSNAISTITEVDGGVTTFTYSSGLLRTITDPFGRTATITMSGTNLSVINFPDNSLRSLSYDANHRLTQDHWGPETVDYTYNASTRTISGVDSGLGSSFAVTPQVIRGLLTVSYAPNATLVDPYGTTSTVIMDILGHVKEQDRALGATETFTLDGHYQVSKYTDPLGYQTQYEYDYRPLGRGDLLKITHPDTGVDAYQYEQTYHFVKVATDPLGHATTAVYTASGDPQTVTDALGGVTTMTWSSGLMQSITDQLGHTTSYSYNSHRHETVVTDALGGKVTTTYDSYESPLTVTDQLGRVTTTVHDIMGRLTQQVDAIGNSTTYAYNTRGWMTGTTDALGHQTAYGFDSHGNQTTITEAVGTADQRTTTIAFDSLDRQTTNTDPLGYVATSSYDVLSRQTEAKDVSGATTSTVYDAAGQATVSIDALGHRATSVYDSMGRQTVSIDALGNRTTTVYDLAGNVLSVKDARGFITSYAYDALNRQTREIDDYGGSLQRTVTTVYDAVGNTLSVKNALGVSTSYAYDALNRQTRVIDDFGGSLQQTTTTVYDAVGNTLSVTRPGGGVTSYAYDALNRQTRLIEDYGGSLQRTGTTAYDAVGNTLYTVNPLGVTTSFAYDALNRQVATIEDKGGSLERRTTTVYDAVNAVASVDPLGHRTTTVFDPVNRTNVTIDALNNRSTTVYDVAGNVSTSTDGLNQTTTYSYDVLNRTSTVKDPLGNVTSTTYDEVGHVLTTVNPRGYTTTFVYDRLNRQQATIDALGNRSTTVYDAGDEVIATINARGYAVTVTYDALGRQTSQTDPFGHVTSTVYDAAGHVSKTVDALGKTTTFSYDSLDRQVTMQSPSGGIASTVYDAGDRVTATIDPLGHRSTSVYDHLNRVTQSVDALNGTTTFVYDAADNRTSLTDPVGNTTTWVYDALNRESTETDPLGKNATFSYNAVGLLTSTTDRLGRRIDYSFDADNRKLTEKWYTTTGVLNQTQTWTYDAVGNALTAQDPDGNYTFTYDALDRTATAQEPFAQALTFAYDPVGNRTVVQDSQSGVTTSTYDAANRLTAREFGGVGQTKLKWENSYTNRDQISVETRYRWTGSAWASIGTSEYSYDDAMRVTNIKHKDSGGTIQANFTYTYDTADRVTSAIDNGTTVSYSYDNTNQLTADGTASYSFDANGNRTMAGYATSTGNRTTNDGTWTYTFDDAGNEIKKSKGAAAETWNYLYDNRNQLIAAEKHATDGGTLLAKVLNKYDALGDRIERDEDADGNGTYETVERFAFDGWKVHQDAGGGQAGFIGQENFDVWADLNGSNVLTTRRLFGDAIDQIVARINSGGTAAWYYQDRLGSVRNLVDATGTLQETLTYDGFGNVLTDSNPTRRDRYTFVARELDSVNALLYDRRRWDDTAAGKWLTKDPIGFATLDANLYRYVGNNPTNARDPSGLEDIPVPHVWSRDEYPTTLLLSAAIADGKLKVVAKEGKDFRPAVKSFGFPEVIAGTVEGVGPRNNFGGNRSNRDTDSLQIAVRWSDANHREVGFTTNANLLRKARKNGAHWEFIGGNVRPFARIDKPDDVQTAIWRTGVPKEATHLELLMVFTDAVWGPEVDAAVIIGSFSADLKGDMWKFEFNKNDCTPAQQRNARSVWPGLAEAQKITDKTREILKNKTGHSLRERPPRGLDKWEWTKARLIGNAADRGIINTGADTGFDLWRWEYGLSFWHRVYLELGIGISPSRSELE